MTFSAPNDLPTFYAHALALERESVERYAELADAMQTHNNDELAELFRKLAGYGEAHAREVLRRCAGLELPNMAPWEYRWMDEEGPETSSYGDVHYLMTAHQALRYAHRNEERGREYYARVAEETDDDSVAEAALEFASEEADHVRLVGEWLEKTPPAQDDWDLELDPPNQPE